MTLGTEIDFRGAKRAVEFDYEGDDIIVWWFTDESVCGGKGTTAAEQDDIHEYLLDYWRDWQDLIDDWA